MVRLSDGDGGVKQCLPGVYYSLVTYLVSEYSMWCYWLLSGQKLFDRWTSLKMNEQVRQSISFVFECPGGGKNAHKKSFLSLSCLKIDMAWLTRRWMCIKVALKQVTPPSMVSTGVNLAHNVGMDASDRRLIHQEGRDRKSKPGQRKTINAVWTLYTTCTYEVIDDTGLMSEV